VRSLFLFSLALSLWAKQPLPALEAKLYAFIQNTQIKEHPIRRYVGTWPSYPKYVRAQKEIPESNAFMTLQTLVLLHELHQMYELPAIEQLFALANAQMLKYADDAEQTAETKGTIAFWPLLQSDEGEWIRSFDTQWYNTSMRILDVGNDFDTSSQAFVWFYLSGQKRSFLDDFVLSSARYRDLNRTHEHPLNLSWKQKDSGAFLTWAEPEAPQKPVNRIMDLVNDVDCVVNLNILTSLSLYENTLEALPIETKEAKESACKLTHEIILAQKEQNCALWYTRPSHFYLAFAKAYKADTFCIQQDRDLIVERARRRARYLLEHPRLEAYTEIAEHLIILKSLKPSQERGFFFKKLLSELEKRLKEGLVEKEEYAYLPSKEALFGGEAFGMFHFNWFGNANATALALRALTMK
jgi:hypothetical protein